LNQNQNPGSELVSFSIRGWIPLFVGGVTCTWLSCWHDDRWYGWDLRNYM